MVFNLFPFKICLIYFQGCSTYPPIVSMTRQCHFHYSVSLPSSHTTLFPSQTFHPIEIPTPAILPHLRPVSPNLLPGHLIPLKVKLFHFKPQCPKSFHFIPFHHCGIFVTISTCSNNSCQKYFNRIGHVTNPRCHEGSGLRP